MKKCLGWHFELERHGNGLSESIELFNVCDGESEIIRVLTTKTRFWYMYEDRSRVMTPAMTQDYIRMLYPDHPNSPDQAYYLTEKGMKVYNAHKDDKIIDGPAE